MQGRGSQVRHPYVELRLCQLGSQLRQLPVLKARVHEGPAADAARAPCLLTLALPACLPWRAPPAGRQVAAAVGRGAGGGAAGRVAGGGRD